MKRIILKESSFILLKKLIFEDYRHTDEAIGIPSIFDFLKTYNVEWVINQFLSGTEREKWFPRIGAYDYKSALYDLQKYGEFRYFDKSKVFTMLARVMANTAILYSNSILINKYINDSSTEKLIPLFTKLVRSVGNEIEKNAVLKANGYGKRKYVDIYAPFTEDTIDVMIDFLKLYTSGSRDEIIKAYNEYLIEKNYGNEDYAFDKLVTLIDKNLGNLSFIDSRGICYLKVKKLEEFINEKMYFWFTTSNGVNDSENCWSYNGCIQLIQILSEYKPGITTAEDAITIIDKALNVIHDRGGLAFIFIQGGDGALNAISGISREEYKDRARLRRADYENKLEKGIIKNIANTQYYG